MVTDAAVFLLLLDNPRTALLIRLSGSEHMVDQYEKIVATATMASFLPSAAKRQNLPFR